MRLPTPPSNAAVFVQTSLESNLTTRTVGDADGSRAPSIKGGLNEWEPLGTLSILVDLEALSSAAAVVIFKVVDCNITNRAGNARNATIVLGCGENFTELVVGGANVDAADWAAIGKCAELVVRSTCWVKSGSWRRRHRGCCCVECGCRCRESVAVLCDDDSG
jgi:hypothetical protein